jgi:hypothetical protein
MTITSKQVIEWSCYAQKRRETEGIDGAWWELIPEDQKPLAHEWIKQNSNLFAIESGK